VIHIVRGQMLAFPDYTVVITGVYFFFFCMPSADAFVEGHSLGGALASIAALSVKSNLPSAAVRLFTYGALICVGLRERSSTNVTV
jgi:predicted lipase